jgi:hypothetical protein
MIDLNIRVKEPNVWEDTARDFGFMDEFVVEPAVLNESDEVTVHAVTEWRLKSGVSVDEIKNIWITPPTFDDNGIQTSDGAKAQGRHFNIRIANPEVKALWSNLWTETLDSEGNVVSRTIEGAQPAESNKSEKAWLWRDVEIIDMTTVATPVRMWM